MNKKQAIIILLITFLAIPKWVFPKEKDPKHWTELLNNVDKISGMDASKISEEQFYEYEQALITGFSGSGGNFLGEKEINWLTKMEESFKKRGITLKDTWHRHYVIADSYFNDERYSKALEEFKKLGDRPGIELSEWMVSNKGITDGVIKIMEYKGKIPHDSLESGSARAEDKRYLFISCFKGPVYRYNKVTDMHAIVYAPEFKYDWSDNLSFDGELLTITLRDDAGIFIFNNVSKEIKQQSKSRSIKNN
ncbi:MAG: hypothetical protein ABH865_00400 [Candidatus Omnitrophota bacterium]